MSLTDDQIRAAYGRLDDTLTPPVDASERVGRRIAVRRRRRRAGLAAGSLAAVAVVAGLVLVGGDREEQDVATDTPGPDSSLVLTRPDGSTYAFDEVSVSCADPGGDREQRLIELSSPFRLVEEGTDERLVVPFLYFRGPLARLEAGETIRLGEPSLGRPGKAPSLLFVADTEGGPRANEVSSDQPDSAGTVTVLEASCDPTPVLRLAVEATLGSEVGQDTLDVRGTVG